MARVFRKASLLLAAATTATAMTSSELSPSATPPARCGSVAVVDATSSRLLIFAGAKTYTTPPMGAESEDMLDDLWAYDLIGNSWTELSPSGAKPQARYFHVAAMDTSNTRLLVHAGAGPATPMIDALDDLWAYDVVGNSWTDLSPSGAKPSKRFNHVAAMDTSNGRLLIHGGYNSDDGLDLDDLWAYDLVGNSWTELSPSGAKPSKRSMHVAAMDTSNGRLLVHAGSDSDDLWAYDLIGNSWTEISPCGENGLVAKPTYRASHAAAMDTSNNRLLVHAGKGASGNLDDLWAYDVVTNCWTELSPSGTTPSARGMHAAALADGSRLIVFGGYVDAAVSDLWQFAWVTSTSTSTATSSTSTTMTATITTVTVDDTANTTADDTANTTATSTSAAMTEMSAVCKCSAPSLFFPLFCVASLATM